jgi:hypothetical protein
LWGAGASVYSEVVGGGAEVGGIGECRNDIRKLSDYLLGFLIIVKSLYKQTLQHLGSSFEVLYSQIGPPKLTYFGNEYAYRYPEKTIHQAIIQKLARLVTGLQTIMLLNDSGLIQEQAVIQRTLDEFDQDINFLCFSVIFSDHTEWHDRYLQAFFDEEFDNNSSAVESSQKRPMIPRKKIIAYLARDRGAGYDQSSSAEIMRTLSKTYSGYVHGASPHLMELCYGEPPEFHLYGSKNSPLFEDHEFDLINYFYRSIITFAVAAKSFGNEKLFKELHAYSCDFALASGKESHLRDKK